MDKETQDNIADNSPETEIIEDETVNSAEGEAIKVVDTTIEESDTDDGDIVTTDNVTITEGDDPVISSMEVAESVATEDKPATQGDASEQPKKSKAPLILTLILVLALAGGIAAWCVFGMGLGGQQNNQSSQGSEQNEYAELTLHGNGLSNFDLEFLKLENKTENIIYSPLSIKYALVMLAEAAGGDSKTQVTNILGEYQPKAYLNSSNRSLANAMFLRTNSPSAHLLKSSYTDTIKTEFNAEVIDDSFESPDAINQWVSDKTLGIIQNMFDKESFNTDLDFVLLNALAIDMAWNNQLQCSSGAEREVPCMFYLVKYAHEDYFAFIDMISEGLYSKVLFNGQAEVSAAEIGASTNRYDIITELGEDYIRTTVQAEYEKWLAEQGLESSDFDMDVYIDELSKNYGQNKVSTDFYFYDSETEKVFAKDLKEYDGATLQYVGFMPKTDSLENYINDMTAEKASELIDNLKVASDVNNYSENVVTKVHAQIPFFKFDYSMDNFVNNLKELGITDVFDEDVANLSGMLDIEQAEDNPYIMDAMHKADIDFSNDGIRAAAVTSIAGGLGGIAPFDYLWDVPVEEIDLTFDKPFFFLIRDKATGEVWFTGQVYNPAS